MKRLLSVVLVAMIILIGCNQSQVVTNLQLAVDAAEVAFPLVAAQANLDPAVVGQINKYLQGVNVAISHAAPILASTEPPAQKAVEVSAIFAGIAAPNLPAGTPQIVANAVTAVANAVAKFLASIPNPKALSGKIAKSTVPSPPDVVKLDKIAKKAHDNLARIKK